MSTHFNIVKESTKASVELSQQQRSYYHFMIFFFYILSMYVSFFTGTLYASFSSEFNNTSIMRYIYNKNGTITRSSICNISNVLPKQQQQPESTSLFVASTSENNNNKKNVVAVSNYEYKYDDDDDDDDDAKFPSTVGSYDIRKRAITTDAYDWKQSNYSTIVHYNNNRNQNDDVNSKIIFKQENTFWSITKIILPTKLMSLSSSTTTTLVPILIMFIIISSIIVSAIIAAIFIIIINTTVIDDYDDLDITSDNNNLYNYYFIND